MGVFYYERCVYVIKWISISVWCYVLCYFLSLFEQLLYCFINLGGWVLVFNIVIYSVLFFLCFLVEVLY